MFVCQFWSNFLFSFLWPIVPIARVHKMSTIFWILFRHNSLVNLGENCSSVCHHIQQHSTTTNTEHTSKSHISVILKHCSESEMIWWHRWCVIIPEKQTIHSSIYCFKNCTQHHYYNTATLDLNNEWLKCFLFTSYFSEGTDWPLSIVHPTETLNMMFRPYKTLTMTIFFQLS